MHSTSNHHHYVVWTKRNIQKRIIWNRIQIADADECMSDGTRMFDGVDSVVNETFAVTTNNQLDARQPRNEGIHSRRFEWKLFPELFVARAPSCTHLITDCVVCYSVSINFQFSIACRMSVAEEQTFCSHAHADTHLPANSDSVMKCFVVERSRIYFEWMHCVLRRCICLPIHCIQHSSFVPIAFLHHYASDVNKTGNGKLDESNRNRNQLHMIRFDARNFVLWYTIQINWFT